MIHRLILVSLVSFLTISPVPLHFWSVNESIQSYSDRNDYGWTINSPDPFSSLDLGSDQDCLITELNAIKLADCHDSTNVVKWQSGDNWKVTETITADLNHDGNTELVMVVWRPFKSWPIDSFLPFGGRITDFQDSRGMSCHVILVGWDGEKYRELWAGSSLIDPVFNIRAADLDQDGYQELIALEGKYDSPNSTGNLTVWDWSGFGFRLRDRLEMPISKFGIVSIDQNVMIISN